MDRNSETDLDAPDPSGETVEDVTTTIHYLIDGASWYFKDCEIEDYSGLGEIEVKFPNGKKYNVTVTEIEED